MSLLDIALAAAVALAPPTVERSHLAVLSSAIVAAVEDREQAEAWLPGSAPLPFTPELSALALVAIAYGESRFSAEVSDCRRIGHDLPSVTVWQLYGTWAFGPFTAAELCASTSRAAERALWVLAQHKERCGTPASVFRGYASGNCGRDSRAARWHCRRWERLARRAGLAAKCE